MISDPRPMVVAGQELKLHHEAMAAFECEGWVIQRGPGDRWKFLSRPMAFPDDAGTLHPGDELRALAVCASAAARWEPS